MLNQCCLFLVIAWHGCIFVCFHISTNKFTIPKIMYKEGRSIELIQMPFHILNSINPCIIFKKSNIYLNIIYNIVCVRVFMCQSVTIYYIFGTKTTICRKVNVGVGQAFNIRHFSDNFTHLKKKLHGVSPLPKKKKKTLNAKWEIANMLQTMSV